VPIAVIEPSGRERTWLSEQRASALGLRHVETDALFHGPSPCDGSVSFDGDF
jgi:hypothetical protein